MGRLVRAFFVRAALVSATLVSACARPVPDAAPAPPPSVEDDCRPAIHDLVDANEVEISGDLDEQKQVMVEWALDRFDQAGLELPSRISFGFDPERSVCGGAAGICRPQHVPPETVICEPDDGFVAQQLGQRITLLHELAHLWHWSQGDGTGWPDRQAIVGGVSANPDSPWADRTEERVAVAISWGLMDQYRRPVRSDLACVELYEQFVGLTGRAPFDPIEIVCVPV